MSADYEAWMVACADIEKLIKSKKKSVKVQFEDTDSAPPQIDQNVIRFNGVRENGHETFIVRRVPHEGRPEWQGLLNDRWFDFCKTARKPYDILVCASLLVLKAHLGDWLELSSDGTWDEWKPARALCKRVLFFEEGDFASAMADINKVET